jgi:hypothetical protein
MMMYYILTDDKRVIPVDDIVKWGQWWLSANRTVEKTQTKLHWVSTVFLGIGWMIEDPPLVFETMTFDSKGGSETVEVDGFNRYSSWDDAVTGHRVIVRRILKAEANAELVVKNASP